MEIRFYRTFYKRFQRKYFIKFTCNEKKRGFITLWDSIEQILQISVTEFPAFFFFFFLSNQIINLFHTTELIER